jgi:hypothetical protein
MKKLYDAANLTILALTGSLIYSAYPRLPERIPVHFGISGRPDRWSGRGSIVALVVLPAVMTLAFYLLIRFIPRLGGNPRYVNIPRKDEFFRLPPEKRDIYWALFKEFLAGLTAAVNLLFYFIIRGTVRVATGGTGLLPLKSILPALGLMALILVFYFRRMLTLPGKLIRGEE